MIWILRNTKVYGGESANRWDCGDTWCICLGENYMVHLAHWEIANLTWCGLKRLLICTTF